jgi:hypothetical protein
MEGAATCSGCDLGSYGSAKGTCLACPAGQYQDGKGETSCKECDADTYLNEQGKSSKADCEACSKDKSTGTSMGNTKAASCLCRKEDFYQHGTGVCKACPLGANCSASDGLPLSQVIPIAGYYLSTLKDNATTASAADIDTLTHFFLDCKIGYKTDSLAQEMCTGGEKNQSNMCKEGYTGVLCVSRNVQLRKTLQPIH